MKKYLCVAAILIFCPGRSSIAQQYLVDSITRQLQQPMIDSNRAISMMRLAIDYELVDTAKAYLAYNDAVAFAIEKKLYYQLGRIYHNQSILLKNASRYTAAITHMHMAITSYQKIKTAKSKKWEANAYGDMAICFKSQNDMQQALRYNLKSIGLFEQLGLKDELVIRYCNLANLFGDIREYPKQEEYAFRALKLAKVNGMKSHLHLAYLMTAFALNNQEHTTLAKSYLDSARTHFNKAYTINSVDMLITYYLVAADVFKKLNQLDSSFYYFHQCLEASNAYNYGFGKAESQLQMGAIAILQKKYLDAERYLLAGIKEAEGMNDAVVLYTGYKFLSDIYAVTGRYKLAYESFQTYKTVGDSVFDMESKKNVTELEKKYETDKKNSQLKVQQLQLRQKDTLNYILIGSAVVFLIVASLLYRSYKQKQKLQQQRISELETEKQLNATEAVLKGEEQERTRLAKDLHDGLGGMLSGIKYGLQTMKGNLIMTPENTMAFERSMDMLDSSIKELRRVAHNMMPEALVKFGLDTALRDYCSSITQSGMLAVNYQSFGLENAMIDQTLAITTYRIVQELINNTLKHASATVAIVQVTQTEQQLVITVEDDGKGFDPIILSQSKGIGWTNIQHRVEFLKGKVDVISATEKGTSVHIEFNV